MADPRDTTVHNPANRQHYMRLRPIAQTICVHAGSVLLGQSNTALRLLEVGKDIYDPVIYLPLADTTNALVSMGDMTTHCPLKGNAHYFRMKDEEEAIAWVYDEPLPFADVLGDHVAFYANKVTITERGVDDRP